jgi:hypothetical protein
MFQRNVLPPSSGLKNDKKPASRQVEAELPVLLLLAELIL